MKKVIKTNVISNEKIAPDHFVMEVGTKWLSKKSSPGQFVMVKVSGIETDPLLRIPLGIHETTNKGIKILYKVVGEATELLSLKRKGDIIDVMGPVGNSFDLKLVDKNTRVFIVAGGHGIAPLYGLVKKLTSKKRIEVFSGACSRKHVIYSKRIRTLGVKYHVATDDGSCGLKGYVTELVEGSLKKHKTERIIIFACGPRPMLAELARITKKYKVPAQFSLDAYMACGTGACQGCAVRTKDGYKLVCKDGPVFRADEIDWSKEKSGT